MHGITTATTATTATTTILLLPLYVVQDFLFCYFFRHLLLRCSSSTRQRQASEASHVQTSSAVPPSSFGRRHVNCLLRSTAFWTLSRGVVTGLTHALIFIVHTLLRSMYILLCIYVFFWPIDIFFLFRLPAFSRALGSAARREPTRTPRACLGPGRGPRHMLWGFQVASPLGEGFQARRAIQVHTNPRTG